MKHIYELKMTATLEEESVEFPAMLFDKKETAEKFAIYIRKMSIEEARLDAIITRRDVLNEDSLVSEIKRFYKSNGWPAE